MNPATERPAVESTGGGRTQHPAAIPVAAEPVRACPRGATGTPSPVRVPRPEAGEGPPSSPGCGRAAPGIPGPETGEADPGSSPVSPVLVRAQSPAGGAHASSREATSVPPAGSTALSGAEWRAAAKAAQSKTRRGRMARGAAARPAAKATTPPVTGGAALTATANCLGRCDWTTGPGDPAEVDKAAERHTTKPPKHPTNVVSEVAL